MSKDDIQAAANDEAFQTSAIHHAAGTGEIDILRQYLEPGVVEGFDLNEVDVSGRTPVIYAVHGGFLDCLELLLTAGASPDTAGVEKRTALHWAAYQGQHKFVKMLLSFNAKVDLRDSDGRTPLHLATGAESSKCIKLLCKEQKVDVVDAVDNDGMTAAHWCAFHNHWKHLDCLLGVSANMEIKDNEGKLPIHWTSTNTDESTLQYVVENAPKTTNSVDAEGRTVLHLAIAENNVPAVRYLCSTPGCNINATDNMKRSGLHWAAVLGHQVFVAELLKNGANHALIDESGATCLHYAAQNDEIACVNALISHAGLKDLPDAEGRTALMWAAGKGSTRSLKAMIKTFPNLDIVDNTGGTALHIAAFTGNSDCVRVLVENKANMNALDSTKATPLFRACEAGHAEAAIYLIQAGAKVGLADIDGRTALHWAALGGFDYICLQLIQSHAAVSAVDLEGRAPLHCASYGGFIDCMSVLLANGAEINLEDNEGVTALHWATASSSLDAVKVLVEHNANVNVMERDGERLTPLDYAVIGDGNGHSFQDIVDYLNSHGALSVHNIRDMAATAIQASFRGYRVRRNSKKNKIGKIAGSSPDARAAKAPSQTWNPSRPSEATGQKPHAKPIEKELDLKSKSKTELKSESKTDTKPPLARTDTKSNAKPVTDSKAKPPKVPEEVRPPPAVKAPEPPRVPAPVAQEKPAPKPAPAPAPAAVVQEKPAPVAQESTSRQSLSRVASAAKLFDPQIHLNKASQARLQSIKEKNRLHTIRKKMSAAVLIQRAWRRWKHRRAQQLQGKAALTKPLKDHGNMKAYHSVLSSTKPSPTKKPIAPAAAHKETVIQTYREEVAALTIQLAWRKHNRERSANQSTKKREHQQKPISASSGLQQSQNIRVKSVYGTKGKPALKVKQPSPPKRPLTYRPPYLNTVPSAAATSFNFALGSYTPSRIEELRKYARTLNGVLI